ncbi:MAG TPA: nucleotide sugar dehydrogenase, partial [Solirubrobacteraceae bacterium]|nr:nucleotide sugar dehydrogenase [Solirubrobacteraceae bacterium]
MAVGVIGLGYVGLPLAVEFAEAGQSVIAVDIDDHKVAAIRAGESYIEDIPSERLKAVLDRIEADTHFAPLARADAVLICVPTPLTPNREPDLGALLGATKGLAAIAQRGQLVVLESTTYPGTTREQVLPLLEAAGLKVGRDINLAFSPERVDPGRTDYTLRNTPKIVGGITPECAERATALYETVCDQVVRVSTPEAAEMAKLLENIFRSVNIALVNELAILADRMGLDIWEVVDAAATKPYGFMRFEPGPGMGGHCLPVDPFYLTWRAREFHMSTEFIELAGKVNQHMPYYCVDRVERALNDIEKPVKGSRIAILGVSYKGGVGDTRESPALRIMQLLADRGAILAYHDPFVSALPELGLQSSGLQDIVSADAVVLVTAHPQIDHGS